MSKKNKIRVGMPFLFNHDGKNIIGTVTKVKETASALEFEVKPTRDKIYISLDQVEEFVLSEDNDRPIGVIFSKNSTDLLEAFEEFNEAAKKFKATAKFSPFLSEINKAYEQHKRNDSFMSKIFGAESFIFEDYPHPDSNPKIFDFGIFQEASLELHCEVCNNRFKPTKDLHYIAKSHTTMFMVPDVETFHDAYDCPRCGSQILAKDRVSAAK